VELTRRDAVAALAAAGVAVGGGVTATRFDPPRAGDGDGEGDGDGGDADVSATTLDVMVAAADVVFPSAVEGRRAFVETYVLGRTESRSDYRGGLTATATALDDVARDWYDEAFPSLDPSRRDELLRRLGVDTADPDPEGNLTDRVRFYVVDDLLFALYSSPTGGRLVGIENPVGHPGGVESYRRATMPEEDDGG
jgi:hypothetical protein